MTTLTRRITVAPGDGIGPEIMDAVLHILQAARVPLEYDFIQVGREVYLQGYESGISPEAWNVIRQNRILLKGPITTPQGGGYKSLNVTLRKALGLFANVRPVRAITPYVRSNFPQMNVVIIRENEEDLYAGIEHQQTAEVIQCLKLVSRPGSERIIRYAFEYARAYGRKKVTCMTKDNIMKMTDGMFHEIFNEVAQEYPDITTEHRIIDIGSALLAERPETFDVIVTLNLYGDIISDIAAQVAGSVGLGGSANIGESFAMFEAIHGSAPDIAGKNIANPSGLLNAAVMMLMHLGLGSHAQIIENAWLKTLEDGIHTADIFRDDFSYKLAKTSEFAGEIIRRLGQKPLYLKAVEYQDEIKPISVTNKLSSQKKFKQLTGVDVFLNWDEHDRNPNVLGNLLSGIDHPLFELTMISNRGIKVFPGGFPETWCTDHWRCRFMARKSLPEESRSKISYKDIINLLTRLEGLGLDIIKTENLYLIDGRKAFSAGQGE